MKKRKRRPITVRCEDCGDEWTAYRAGRCPLCGGPQVRVKRRA